MKCPECGAECDQVEVDIGVGIQYGPAHCPECGWSQEDEVPELDFDEDDECPW